MKIIAALALSLALLPLSPTPARAETSNPKAEGAAAPGGGSAARPEGEKRSHAGRKPRHGHHKAVAQKKAHGTPAPTKEAPPRDPGFDDRKIAAVKVAPQEGREETPAEKPSAQPTTERPRHASKPASGALRAERRKAHSRAVKHKKPAHHGDHAASAKKSHTDPG